MCDLLVDIRHYRVRAIQTKNSQLKKKLSENAFAEKTCSIFVKLRRELLKIGFSESFELVFAVINSRQAQNKTTKFN